MGKSMIDLKTNGSIVTSLSDDDLLLVTTDPSGTPDDNVIALSDLRDTLLPGYIQENSAQLLYVGTAAYSVLPGSAVVNGSLLTWSSNIARTGLTISSGTLYYVYLYDNEGTPAVEESTTEPVWDSSLSYYQKTGDASRRCIGWIHGNSSSQLRQFVNNVYGRVSEIIYLDLADLISSPAVDGGTSTAAWASFSLDGAPSHAKDYYCAAKIILPSDGDEGILGISPVDLGSSIAAANAPYTVRGNAGKATARMFFGRAWLPISTSDTQYYRLTQQSGSPTAAIEVQGARIIR